MRQGTAGEHHEFQRVVKHLGIGAFVIDNRHDLLEIVAEQVGVAHGLASMHPVHIAPQGVDFTVVDHVAVRMRTFPAGESIGTKAGMH
ncbi:hypothetical protein D3C75_1099250 [compost metagenome]